MKKNWDDIADKEFYEMDRSAQRDWSDLRNRLFLRGK
jgi:hypothetical protein